MNTHVTTSEVTTLMERCEKVHYILWRYGTQEHREENASDFDRAIDRFRTAAKAVMSQQEVIEPAGVETMLRYVLKHDADELLTKFDAIAILFQTMRMRLRSTFTDAKKSVIVKSSIPETNQIRSFAPTCFTRRDLDQLVSIGRKMNNVRLSETSVIQHCTSRRGLIMLGMNRVREEIASYAICNLAGTGVDILSIEAAPNFDDTDARMR